MTAEQLSRILKENGIVGAGGAGFPTYAKIDQRAETILLNCAECEPLLRLHRQLLCLHTQQILDAFAQIAATVGAKEAIIGVKAEYQETVEALKQYVPRYPNMRIHLLQSAYPMGDEVVLIYEATGKVISPGGLPIEAGVAVFNVETVYNVSRALNGGHPVTDKLVSVVGEVKKPRTVRVPLGLSLGETVTLAGGEKEEFAPEELAYLVGGPMMGRLGSRQDAVTKTTNAILVLPKGHPLIQKRLMPASVGMKRAASACCQCETCTDLCPRHNLGHPIEPHRFMRAMSSHDSRDTAAYQNLFFCSGCGVCELFACPQGLSPRTLIAECKDGLKKAGLKAPSGVVPSPVTEAREFRKVPEMRLTARLGLSAYESKALLDDNVQQAKRVKEPLSQHIGAPALCIVSRGERVEAGQVIAQAAQGLSVPIHASISGVVTDMDQSGIEITAD